MFKGEEKVLKNDRESLKGEGEMTLRRRQMQ